MQLHAVSYDQSMNLLDMAANFLDILRSPWSIFVAAVRPVWKGYWFFRTAFALWSRSSKVLYIYQSQIFHHWVFYWNVDMTSWFPNLVSWESKALVSWWAIPISGYQKMHKNMEMSANSAYKVISDKTPGPVCTLHRWKSCKQIGHGNFTEWTEAVTLVEVECFC